jgi:hypothetical protein
LDKLRGFLHERRVLQAVANLRGIPARPCWHHDRPPAFHQGVTSESTGWQSQGDKFRADVTSNPRQRWLASKGRNAEALKNLAWVRKRDVDSELVQIELAEVVAAIEEDKAATAGAKWSYEITRRGNPKRFFIAVVIFILQQWSGQNR